MACSAINSEQQPNNIETNENRCVTFPSFSIQFVSFFVGAIPADCFRATNEWIFVVFVLHRCAHSVFLNFCLRGKCVESLLSLSHIRRQRQIHRRTEYNKNEAGVGAGESLLFVVIFLTHNENEYRAIAFHNLSHLRLRIALCVLRPHSSNLLYIYAHCVAIPILNTYASLIY